MVFLLLGLAGMFFANFFFPGNEISANILGYEKKQARNHYVGPKCLPMYLGTSTHMSCMFCAKQKRR
jgi:hypothetical protein